MIKRVHRQLKAALMRHGETWVRSLPIVLVGMSSAFKEDLKATSAELVYGESLKLPDELHVSSSDQDSITDSADFVAQLRPKMSTVRPAPASRHCQPASFIFKELSSATHVFLREDAFRRPLQPPVTKNKTDWWSCQTGIYGPHY